MSSEFMGTLWRTLDYDSKRRRDFHGVFQGDFHRFFTGRLENHMGNAMEKTSPRPPRGRGDVSQAKRGVALRWPGIVLVGSAICLVAGARNHLQANRTLEFRFEVAV